MFVKCCFNLSIILHLTVEKLPSLSLCLSAYDTKPFRDEYVSWERHSSTICTFPIRLIKTAFYFFQKSRVALVAIYILNGPMLEHYISRCVFLFQTLYAHSLWDWSFHLSDRGLDSVVEDCFNCIPAVLKRSFIVIVIFRQGGLQYRALLTWKVLCTVWTSSWLWSEFTWASLWQYYRKNVVYI